MDRLKPSDTDTDLISWRASPVLVAEVATLDPTGRALPVWAYRNKLV